MEKIRVSSIVLDDPAIEELLIALRPADKRGAELARFKLSGEPSLNWLLVAETRPL